jgi:hypothetical protein
MAETSPVVTDFPITLAGKEYILSYPIPSIWAFEDVSGSDIMSGGISRDEILSMSVRKRMDWVISLLWAGLIAHQPEMTRAAVASLVYFKDIAKIESRVVEAFQASLPSVAEAADADPLAKASQQS